METIDLEKHYGKKLAAALGIMCGELGHLSPMAAMRVSRALSVTEWCALAHSYEIPGPTRRMIQCAKAWLWLHAERSVCNIGRAQLDWTT